MRSLALFLSWCLVLPLAPRAAAQEAELKLNLVVVEGDGAINNIRQRTAREPIVQVEDQNHKPIAGAVVVFTLPSQGAGGTFANGSHTLTVMTDNQGRAVAHGLRPNNVQGQYQIHINASYNGQTVNKDISQSNAVAAAGAAAATGISGKLIAILAIAGAAAAGGIVYATRSGGTNTTNPGNTTTATSPVTINPGTGTVGPPR